MFFLLLLTSKPHQIFRIKSSYWITFVISFKDFKVSAQKRHGVIHHGSSDTNGEAHLCYLKMCLMLHI